MLFFLRYYKNGIPISHFSKFCIANGEKVCLVSTDTKLSACSLSAGGTSLRYSYSCGVGNWALFSGDTVAFWKPCPGWWYVVSLKYGNQYLKLIRLGGCPCKNESGKVISGEGFIVNCDTFNLLMFIRIVWITSKSTNHTSESWFT